MTRSSFRLDRSRRHALCLATAAAALGSAAHTVLAGDDAGPCPYAVEVAGNAPNCGFWGYSILNPRGLNNLGHWVGFRRECPDNLWEIPIKWTPEGGLVNIPVPPQTDRCWAYDINDLGTVVGVRVGVTDGQSHGHWACIWLPDGQFIEIPPLGGCPAHSWATAVSNSGIVVGARWLSCNVRSAFEWKDGELVDLNPARLGFSIADARGVSDTGFVVGQLGDDSTGTGRGFRWKDAAVEILPPLPGANTSDAKTVSASGEAFGQCRFVQGSTTYYRAARWGLDGTPIELPPLPGHVGSFCTAVANDGTVVGRSRANASASSDVDIVWIDGVPFPIEEYLDTPTPNQYSSAQAVNDLGQIVCNASVPPGGGAWMLTPTGSIADLNADCVVDGVDLSLLLQQWGAVPDAVASADLNLDGTIDGADLGLLLGAWSGGG